MSHYYWHGGRRRESEYLVVICHEITPYRWCYCILGSRHDEVVGRSQAMREFATEGRHDCRRGRALPRQFRKPFLMGKQCPGGAVGTANQPGPASVPAQGRPGARHEKRPRSARPFQESGSRMADQAGVQAARLRRRSAASPPNPASISQPAAGSGTGVTTFENSNAGLSLPVKSPPLKFE